MARYKAIQEYMDVQYQQVFGDYDMMEELEDPFQPDKGAIPRALEQLDDQKHRVEATGEQLERLGMYEANKGMEQKQSSSDHSDARGKPLSEADILHLMKLQKWLIGLDFAAEYPDDLKLSEEQKSLDIGGDNIAEEAVTQWQTAADDIPKRKMEDRGEAGA